MDELCAAIDPGTPLDRLLTWWPAAGAASGAFLAGMAVQRQSWPLWGTAAVRTARYNACARRRPWRESAQAPRAR